MAMHSLPRLVLSISLALWISQSGYKRKRLSRSGATAAFIVGMVTLYSSLSLGVTMLLFYYTSSKFTRFRESEKKKLEDHFREGGQRDAWQVMANAFNSSIMAAALFLANQDQDSHFHCVKDLSWNPSTVEGIQSLLAIGFLGHFACCTGDTWASEIGSALGSSPFLITTLKRVPPGTNGGVSGVGLAASAAGGTFIGIVMCVTLFLFGGLLPCESPQWPMIPLGCFAGLFGSLVDSFLGATLQATFYNNETKKITEKSGSHTKKISGVNLLSNNAVNYISSTITALVTALVAPHVFLLF